jgi:hypothetical protein
MDITLIPMSDYCLTGCDEDMENTVNSDKQGNLNGETFISQSLGPRHLLITGFLNTGDSAAAMKRRLERVFNASLTGVLVYTNGASGIRRALDCCLESFPDIGLKGKMVSFEIELIALKPLWMGPGIAGTISAVNKKGKFPLIIPAPDKFLFGYRLEELKAVVDNPGDVAAGIEFHIEALGALKNPSITHYDSGRTIKIFYNLEKGDYIDVYCMPDRASVMINGGAPGMMYLTDETQRQFFTLYTGPNLIGYNADLNAANMDIYYKCVDLYLGV